MKKISMTFTTTNYELFKDYLTKTDEEMQEVVEEEVKGSPNETCEIKIYEGNKIIKRYKAKGKKE